MTDAEFRRQLREFLGPHGVIPLYHNADGSIDRQKTLLLPCYQDFKLKESKED